jgi:hypothetical protein
MLGLMAPAAPSSAQPGLIDLVPTAEFLDERGVDVTGPVYRHYEPLLSIGGGPHPLNLDLTIVSPGQFLQSEWVGYGDIGHATYLGLNAHAYHGSFAASPRMNIALPYQSAKFAIYGSGQNIRIELIDDRYISVAFNAELGNLNYVGVDGTEADFPLSGNAADTGSWETTVSGGVQQIRYPDGEVWTYRYNNAPYNGAGTPGGSVGQLSRVRSIVSSRGYAIQFDYASEATGTLTSESDIRGWVSPVRATAYNRTSVYCDESLLQSCASVTALSSAVTFAYDRANRRVTITKPNGEQVQLTFNLTSTLNLVSVVRPGGVSRSMTYEEWTEQDGPTYRYLRTLTEAGRTWDYGFSPISTGGATVSVFEPGGGTSVYGSSGTYIYSAEDPLQRVTLFGYSGFARFGSRVYPEGNQITAGYDARGNLNLVRQIPRPGSGLPTLEASAVYPASCTSADRRSCNQPVSQTDRNGNTTDYTYAPEHGGVLTETRPAANGIRPQTRYSYVQRYAWVSDGAGGYVQASAPIWLLATESRCMTGAAHASGTGCALPNDEQLTTYDYGPDSGPNNLLLRGVTVTGPGVSSRTCYGYDRLGRRISETGPGASLTSCP